jgi:hypothetical protein
MDYTSSGNIITFNTTIPGGSNIQAYYNCELNTYWTTEVISSSTTGSDSSYTTTNTPSSTILVYINELLQREGIDYWVTGNNIVFDIVIPQGSIITAYYSYLA